MKGFCFMPWPGETKQIRDYQEARLLRNGKIEPLFGFGTEPTLLGNISGKDPPSA
jgi:hypothetical protein